MAIHFAASADAVACGRTGASLDSTEDKTQVSCKLCLRSLDKETVEPVRKTPTLAELRAAAKAAKAAAEAPGTKPAVTLSARAQWQQRLEQMPGKNRLPRGLAKQSFV